MVVTDAGERRRAEALGTYTAFFDLGFGLGAPLVGAISSLAGYPAAFWASAAFAVAGGVNHRGGPIYSRERARRRNGRRPSAAFGRGRRVERPADKEGGVGTAAPRGRGVGRIPGHMSGPPH